MLRIHGNVRLALWFAVAAPFAAGAASAVGGFTFEAANRFGRDALETTRCSVERTGDALVLTGISPDHQLIWRNLAFDPSVCGDVTYRYRATGAGSNRGQFYWSHAGEKFSDERRCFLPPLVADGRWHTVTLKKADFSDYAKWKAGGVVESVRLDMTDSPGGRIELAFFRLAAPTGGGTVATAFPVADGLDEAVWPPVRPAYLDAASSERQRPAVLTPARLVVAAPECAECVAGEAVVFRFRFSGPVPKIPFSAAIEFLDGGRLAWRCPHDFVARDAVPVGTNDWEVSLAATLPKWFSTRTLDWRLVSDTLALKGCASRLGSFTVRRAAFIDGADRPVVSCVREVNGSLDFFVNGQPFDMLWAVPEDTKRPDGRSRVGPLPINVFTAWNWARDWVSPEGEVVTSHFDWLAGKILEENPDAYLMWDLSVVPSPKWQREHPDHLMLDDRGGRQEYRLMTPHSFASASANEDMANLVEKAIRYLEASSYANRILGYRISGGETPEWLAFRPAKDRLYDFSPIAKSEFRKWARAHYPELGDVEIPSRAEREALDRGDLLWSDPRRHLATIAFHEFYSDKLADAIIAVNGRAKKLVGDRKVVGTYCGYTMYLNACGADHLRAHFALKKVLDARVIDFVMSPQSYGVRRLGDTMGDMKPFRTFELHGIMPVIENDMRTHNTTGWRSNFQTMTPFQTTSMYRRDMAIELCRRHPQYILPNSGGLCFDFPEMADEGRVFKTLTDYQRRTGMPRRNAEVALVVSEETIVSMPMYKRMVNGSNRVQRYEKDGSVSVRTPYRTILTGEAFMDTYNAYARAGAPVDYLLAEDLADHSGNYRLYVFGFNFKYDDRFRAAVEKLRARGAAILWLYAPGYTKGLVSSLDNMRALTGIDFAKNDSAIDAAAKMADGRMMGQRNAPVTPTFYPTSPSEVLGAYANGKPAVAAVKTGSATAYFCGPWMLDQKFLRDIYRRAGVHVYTEATDPVEANEKLFTLHARFPGVKKVTLPRRTNVVDVFGRRLVARNADSFMFTASLHSTHVFYCADDAEGLLSDLGQ